jgi:hypothetical protein
MARSDYAGLREVAPPGYTQRRWLLQDADTLSMQPTQGPVVPVSRCIKGWEPADRLTGKATRSPSLRLRSIVRARQRPTREAGCPHGLRRVGVSLGRYSRWPRTSQTTTTGAVRVVGRCRTLASPCPRAAVF